MGGAIVTHHIAKYYSELVSKIVLMDAAVAAPCFAKGEKIFLMDLKKSTTCDNPITQSKQDRPKMVSLTYPRCSLRRELSKQGDVRIAIFNKCASISICFRKVSS